MLAQRLVAERGWPLGEVHDAKPRSGTLRCVLDSLLRRHPPIRYEGPPPERFDIVVLVAPIWAARLAAPMRSFVEASAANLRNVAVVSVMGSHGAPHAVEEVTRVLGCRPILEAAFLQREIEDGSSAARLGAFARAVDRIETYEPAPVRPAAWSPTAG